MENIEDILSSKESIEDILTPPKSNFQKFTGGFSKAIDDFYSGEAADQWYATSSAGKILSAFGQGVANNWGARVDPNLRGIADRASIEADQNKDWGSIRKHIAKTYNTAFFRPLATAIDGAVSAGTGALFGALGGIGAAGQEVGSQMMEYSKDMDTPGVFDPTDLIGMLGEQIYHRSGVKPQIDHIDYNTGEVKYAGNWAYMGYTPELDFAQRALVARSKGRTGEGEAGYFNTREPSTEAVEARQWAAREAGLNPAEVTVSPPRQTFDINDLARELDPATYKKWDELQELKMNIRSSIDYLAGKRGEKYDRDITALLAPVGGDESQLPEALTKRLANLRKLKADEEANFTPEMLKLQQRFIEADAKVRDLIPDQANARARAEAYLKDDSPEGQAFVQWVQAKKLEAALRGIEVQQDMKIARDRAEELQPKVTPQEAANNVIKEGVEPKEVKTEGTVTEKADKEVGSTTPNYSDVPEGQKTSTAPIEGTGDLRERAYSRRVEALAIEEELTDGFSDKQMYRGMKWDEQARLATEFRDKDYQLAKQVALGHSPAPPGILPEAIALAVEKRAIFEKDVETLRNLAVNSELAAEQTLAGQRIGYLSNRNNSPVQAIEIIKANRLQKYAKAVEAEMEKMRKDGTLQKAIEAEAGSDGLWEEFIRAIQCDY